jgi:prepilin-type N-terminal cleavage/methylation domain-containing protein/prepilin-type processing-associated H-X9-DG protein
MPQSAAFPFTSPRPCRRRAFSLIELLVVIAIISLLAAILFPVFSTARAKARQASCQSNLRQITAGFGMYKGDFDSVYPYWNWHYSSAGGSKTPNHLESLWFNSIYPYVKNADVYRCPDAVDGRSLRESLVWEWTQPDKFDAAGIVPPLRDRPVNYGMSETLSTGRICNVDDACTEGGLDRPAESMLVADCHQGLTNDFGGRPKRNDPNDPWHRVIITRVAYANGPADCYANPDDSCGAKMAGSVASFGPRAALYDKQTRHAEGSNIAFTDGHVKWYKARQITYDLFAGDGHP